MAKVDEFNKLKTNDRTSNQLKIESTVSFNQDKKYVLEYLTKRNVKDEFYFDFIKNNRFGFLQNNVFLVDGIEYSLDCFCSCSDISGHDIIGVNKNAEEYLNNPDEIVIAGVSGDDCVLMNVKTGEILLWLTETGDYEKIHIANSLEEFVEMIKFA